MKIAISNIAWPDTEEHSVAARLGALGAQGVEIAPTKRWGRPAEAAALEAEEYRNWWSARGLPVVALQSLLYGRNDLVIFGDDSVRAETATYLERIIDLAAHLGATNLVFGSPLNRQVGSLDRKTIERLAVPFFTRVGAYAHSLGINFCIEPNPPQYKCDWLIDTRECVAFLELVGVAGLALHLDAAALSLNAEPLEPTFALAAPWLRHFHASEPYLAPVAGGAASHAKFAAALRTVGYGGWVSIEMRPVEDARATLAHVAEALEFVRAVYGG